MGRVLMLVTRDQRRGPELFAATLAAELATRGVAVVLRGLATSRSGRALGVATLGRRPLGLTTLAGLRREMRSSDVVVAFGSKTLPACALAAVGLGVPLVYQNIGDPMYWAGGPVRRRWVRLLLSRMAAVAALTEQSATLLEAHFGVPPSRITVIRNARSTTRFRPATAEERRRSRERLGLDHDASVITIAGALAPEKRVDLAIRAVSRTARPLHLVVVGTGPLGEELRSLADQVAPGRVTFLGACDDMPAVYWASDAVIIASASEGVPGVLVEAALSGLPVVATDVGFVRDVVLHGETGLLVPDAEPGHLAAAIEEALRRGEELGSRARQHGEERFGLESCVGSWLQLVQAVRNGGGSRVAVAE